MKTRHTTGPDPRTALLGAALAFTLVCAPAICCGQTEPRPARVLADSFWVEDIKCFARELPRLHKNLFFNISEAEFSTLVSGLLERVPESNDYEIVVGIMRILAAVGDPHTVAGIGLSDAFSKLPVKAEWYSEGLFVVRTAPQLRELLGQPIIGIEGRSIEDVHGLLAEVIPHHNQALLLNRGPQHMAFPEILVALGIADEPDTIVFNIESLGEVAVAALPLDSEIPWVSVLDSLDCDPPLYLQRRDRYYWFTYLEDSGVLYVNYTSCKEMTERPFEAFAAEVLAAADSFDVEKLVFDIRNNGGGNSAVAGPLISGIKAHPRFNRSGRLFVITGRRTFSSAVLNALELMEGGNAILVGEPTGGKPNSYGEVRFFMLPNSMIPIQYSTKYFSPHPENISALHPDLPAEPSFENLIQCRDTAMEVILAR